MDDTTAPATSIPFQLFKDLPPAIESALRDSIDRFGVLVPVAHDQHGNVLDGHQRARIANELGVKYPVNIIEVADEAEAREIARTLNEDRRAMPKEERLEVVKALREDGHSIRAIAGAVGVSKSQVANDLADCPPLDNPSRVIRTGGGTYPSRRVPKLPASDAIAQAKEVKREARQERIQARTEQRAHLLRYNHPLEGADYCVFAHDIRDGAPDIAQPAAVITDPPYPAQYSPLYRNLGYLALALLPASGSLLAMCGQASFLDVCAEFGRVPAMQADQTGGLRYQWVLNYYTPGQSTQVFGRHVKSNWKPVLWYVKGSYSGEHIDDTIRSGESDKRFHEWGQSVSGMAAIIERFTVPGDLIYDPFCGGGTTGVAALLTGRLFVGSDIDEACVKQTAARLAEVAP